MRDEAISKGAIMLGSIIGSIVIVGIIVTIVYLVKGKVNDATEVLTGEADSAIESTYTDYDGDTVTGTEVLSAISKFKNDTIFVAVDNGSGTLTYYWRDADLNANETTLSDAKSKSDLSKYITPSANFLGEVIRDDGTNAIKGITFTKVE